MFGRLNYTPAEYYKMGFLDMLAAIDGFGDGEIKELNNVRHIMWAPLAAMGSKITPRQLIPLPTDGVSDTKPVTKAEFLALARKMAELDKNKKVKA